MALKIYFSRSVNTRGSNLPIFSSLTSFILFVHLLFKEDLTAHSIIHSESRIPLLFFSSLCGGVIFYLRVSLGVNIRQEVLPILGPPDTH